MTVLTVLTAPTLRAAVTARPVQHGFTLVELMISLVVLAVLTTMGAPRFFEWLQNSQTRSGAEAVLNGIQVARSEAIQRNARVMVVFVPPSTGWTVSVDADDTVIQSRSGAEGTSNAVLTATPAAAMPRRTATMSTARLKRPMSTTPLQAPGKPYWWAARLAAARASMHST